MATVEGTFKVEQTEIGPTTLVELKGFLSENTPEFLIQMLKDLGVKLDSEKVSLYLGFASGPETQVKGLSKRFWGFKDDMGEASEEQKPLRTGVRPDDYWYSRSKE